MKLQAQRSCCDLGRPLFVVRMIWVPKKSHFGDSRRSFFEKLKTFRRKCVLEERYTRRNSARSTKALDKTKLFGIGATDENEWDPFINLLRSRRDISADSQNHGGAEAPQVGQLKLEAGQGDLRRIGIR